MYRVSAVPFPGQDPAGFCSWLLWKNNKLRDSEILVLKRLVMYASEIGQVKIKTCAFCKQTRVAPLDQCTGCNGVAYCSEYCRKRHWQSHWKICKNTI